MAQVELGRTDDPPRHGAADAAGVLGTAASEQAFWAEFAGAATVEAFVQSWLGLQCRRVGGVWGGILLLGAPDRGPYSPVAVWPNQRRGMTHVAPVAEQALTERRGLVVRREPDGGPDAVGRERYEIAYPIQVDGHLHGVVVLDVAPRPEPQLQGVLRQLQWGSAWLEVIVRREEAARDRRTTERLQTVFDLVAAAVGHGSFYAAATAFVTAVATRLECDRVSLGFVRRGRVRLRAMSHTAHFAKQTELIRAIGAAMDEVFDQQAVVVYPAPSDRPPVVTRAHTELAVRSGAGAICSVPLSDGGRVAGVLTLERSGDRPFDGAAVELCEALGALAGPILEVQRRDDRSLVAKAAEAARTELGRLIGPRHLGRKLALVAVLAIVVFFSFAQGDYRVTAKTVVEAEVLRAVVAPFDGFIARVEVRPGDAVREGQVLATLDDRDLQLERQKRLGEREQLTKQLHKALADRNAALVRIIQAQIDQAAAYLQLLDDQLSRVSLRAPFDGIVVTGDLSQRLGAPVGRGHVLFEIAPPEAYRVVLQVDERDIDDVKLGQQGHLVLPAMPGEPLPFVIEKITPVSTTTEGRNFFRVEAHLEGPAERLQPGMAGVAKIGVDRRLLIWVWAHDVIDWLRLTLWAWLP